VPQHTLGEWADIHEKGRLVIRVALTIGTACVRAEFTLS
jgi:hypothetical protein